MALYCLISRIQVRKYLAEFCFKAVKEKQNTLNKPKDKNKYLDSRAATNDYFDSRLVGRLFFRLIGLKKHVFFFFY